MDPKPYSIWLQCAFYHLKKRFLEVRIKTKMCMPGSMGQEGDGTGIPGLGPHIFIGQPAHYSRSTTRHRPNTGGKRWRLSTSSNTPDSFLTADLDIRSSTSSSCLYAITTQFLVAELIILHQYETGGVSCMPLKGEGGVAVIVCHAVSGVLLTDWKVIDGLLLDRKRLIYDTKLIWL